MGDQFGLLVLMQHLSLLRSKVLVQVQRDPPLPDSVIGSTVDSESAGEGSSPSQASNLGSQTRM